MTVVGRRLGLVLGVLAVGALAGMVTLKYQAPAAAQEKASGRITAEDLKGIDPDVLGRFIRQYMLDNPEIIMQAAQRLQQDQRTRSQAAQKSALAENRDAVFKDPRAPSLGPEDAAITVVEFFDYECGYCRKSLPAVQALIAANPDIRFVFKEFPILADTSVEAAKAALAAHEQGAYQEYHAALMSHGGRKQDAVLVRLAKEVGLDVEAFNEARNSGRYDAYLESTRELAAELGIRGTPAFIVGDEILPGALGQAALQRAVDTAREDAS